MSQEGVILYPSDNMRDCCVEATNSEYTVMTEVYPDSAGMTDEECNKAQVASIVGALEHVLIWKKS